MPLITNKVFESELTKDQAAEMIQDITEAVIPYVGEVCAPTPVSLSRKSRAALGGLAGEPLDFPTSARSRKAHRPISGHICAGHEHKRFEEQSHGQR